MSALTTQVHAQTTDPDLESSYRFLVSGRETDDGILYTAKAGQLKGRQLPLSFADSAEYWGAYVCRLAGNTCRVVDIYNRQTSTLTPQKSTAGDLQTERINTHNGSNIYDAAVWQIAVMLGQAVNRFVLPNNQDGYTLVSNQNHLLKEGYNGDSRRAMPGENRAVTAGTLFTYNHQAIVDPQRAYTFRMLPKNWLSADPLIGTQYAGEISADGLPVNNPDYQLGKVTWTDWKPLTGENSWAFLLGPLQAACIHYIIDKKLPFVPLHDPAVDNAINILPTFAAMQSPSSGVYYVRPIRHSHEPGGSAGRSLRGVG